MKIKPKLLSATAGETVFSMIYSWKIFVLTSAESSLCVTLTSLEHFHSVFSMRRFFFSSFYVHVDGEANFRHFWCSLSCSIIWFFIVIGRLVTSMRGWKSRASSHVSNENHISSFSWMKPPPPHSFVPFYCTISLNEKCWGFISLEKKSSHKRIRRMKWKIRYLAEATPEIQYKYGNGFQSQHQWWSSSWNSNFLARKIGDKLSKPSKQSQRTCDIEQ